MCPKENLINVNSYCRLAQLKISLIQKDLAQLPPAKWTL